MKILDYQNLKALDAVTIKNQQISSDDLMERAGKIAFHWIISHIDKLEEPILVFCGVGNNGGDGLVIARLLHQNGYEVIVYIISFNETHSLDFTINFNRLKELEIPFFGLNNKNDFIDIKPSKTIIDAVFGIGLSRSPSDFIKELFAYINSTESYIIAIDIPSGLYLNQIPQDPSGVIQADITLTFHLPKLIFFLTDTASYSNEIVVLDIGLDKSFLASVETNQYFIDQDEVLKKYKSIHRFTHKGIQGHVLIIGGSYGKIGAVCLSSKAALKTGCGLVTAFVPKCGYEILQTYSPEVMVLTDLNEKYISKISFEFTPNAIGIGPGLGQGAKTQKALYEFFKVNMVPLVIDADALNILAQNPEWLSLLPPKTILTPHPKELERIIGKWNDDFEKFEKVKKISIEYDLIVVIKGAPTMIVEGDNLFVNSSGNPALATAGTGDVLTGMITSLLAQSYQPIDAAILGVYLHGTTADIALPETGYQSFIASDIISNIGKAYLSLRKV